ncbi:FkbM family methyltransferase [Actinoplanes sp. N902-109]|uniref:FkbM family methyltransferase n=1 Tax=Actinoplanes sp. (strain N902-109) TaxID=649831 RepID=UPI000329418A|nr:FkbM family methyltransferase [Actinoplanes sp. N902-109]AGL16327.1 methyltransferase FkbM [Actinoplanes sp. N902-109]
MTRTADPVRPQTPAPAGRRAGRLARRHPATARLLTQWQAARLRGRHGMPEMAACHHLATPGSLAVDVGASVGNFTRALVRAVGRDGHVLALEANPQVYEELRRSTWSSHVTALNLAASDDAGWARLSIPLDGAVPAGQLSTLEAPDGRAALHTTVRRIRLDDLIGAARPVSLLKIDVEGHESAVLAGAVETIERWRPAVVAEIEQRHLNGRTVADVAGALLAHGYTAWGLRGRSLLPWAEFDQHRHQQQWLSTPDGGGLSRITAPHEYVNNFVFLPVERAADADGLRDRLAR